MIITSGWKNRQSEGIWCGFPLFFLWTVITFKWAVFLLPLVLYNVYHTRKAAKEFFKDCQNSIEMKECLLFFFFFNVKKSLWYSMHRQKGSWSCMWSLWPAFCGFSNAHSHLSLKIATCTHTFLKASTLLFSPSLCHITRALVEIAFP